MQSCMCLWPLLRQLWWFYSTISWCSGFELKCTWLSWYSGIYFVSRHVRFSLVIRRSSMITKNIVVKIRFSIGELQIHGSGLSQKILNEGNFVSHRWRIWPSGETVNRHVGVHSFEEGISVLETSSTVSLLIHQIRFLN